MKGRWVGAFDIGKTYKPGDPPPEGYNAWHEWAAAQHRAGLRQRRCRLCGLWKFPQELDGGACSPACPNGIPPNEPRE